MIEVESSGSLPLFEVIVRPIQRHERARHWLRHPIPHPDWSTPTVFVKIVVTFFTQLLLYCRVPRVHRRHAQD